MNIYLSSEKKSYATVDTSDGTISCMDFSEWLNSQMIDRNWSQSDLARAAKISNTAISNVLNGSRKPGPEFCTSMAQAFGYPPDVVFRAAGLLPPHKDMDEETEQMLYLFDRLETADQEVLLNMAKFFLNRREQDKPARPRLTEG